MNSSEFGAFLDQAGNAYKREQGGDTTVFYFRDRGLTFMGVAHDRDPKFLNIRCLLQLEKGRDAEKVAHVLTEVEDRYPVVKLKQLGDDESPGFEVAAEQFEPNADSIAPIFWRTIDLMHHVAGDVYAHLAPPAPAAKNADAENSWLTEIEDGLRNGCPAAEGKEDTPTYHIRASLAMIAVPDGTASTFCVASDETLSFYVTNAHVVGQNSEVLIYRQAPHYEKMRGTVVAVGHSRLDLAVVSVPTPNIPPVTIYSGRVQCDSPVGVAGYPRVQLWAAKVAGEITASVHFGTITSVSRDGATIMHDAVSRPGNSGGPIFDPGTGHVYGVLASGWEGEEEAVAIGPTLLASFLQEHGVLLHASEQSRKDFRKCARRRPKGSSSQSIGGRGDARAEVG